MRQINTDVLVLGSGGAGLTAATVAAAEGARVCLVSKDPIAGGDTKIAEGNITVVSSGSPKDTRDELVSNMRLQGIHLVKEVIRPLVSHEENVKEGVR